MAKVRCLVLMPLMLASSVNTLAQEASSSQVQELAHRALANYEVRQAHAADYTWREEWATQVSVQGKKSKYKVFPTSRFDEYEVIPVGKDFYRRHIRHNGQALPQQEEAAEQQKLQAALHKSVDEGVRLRPARDRSVSDQSVEAAYAEVAVTSDVQLQEIRSLAGAIRGEMQDAVTRAGDHGSTMFTAQVFKSVLPEHETHIDRLLDSFTLRLKGREILEGRGTYVLEAVPKRDAEGDLENFELRIWIDETEPEIVKIEEKAVRQGVVSSKPEYVAMNPVNYPDEAVGIAKDLEYQQSLHYEPGMTITHEWAKVNNEIWLPKRLEVKGRELFSCSDVTVNGQVRPETAHLLVTQERTYSAYEKFRVRTRIFDAKPR